MRYLLPLGALVAVSARAGGVAAPLAPLQSAAHAVSVPALAAPLPSPSFSAGLPALPAASAELTPSGPSDAAAPAPAAAPEPAPGDNAAWLAAAVARLRAKDAEDGRSLTGIPAAKVAAAGWTSLPQARLVGVLSTKGGNSVLFFGELPFEGRTERVAVKVLANGAPERREGEEDASLAARAERAAERRLELFAKEIVDTRELNATLPRGWAPRFYGAVDAGGNPALALEVVKGKDVESLTPAEAALLTDERIEKAMAAIALLRPKGLVGIDSPGVMMLTEDQAINGARRSRGDLVFFDAVNMVDEMLAQSPQDMATKLLVMRETGARFAATHPDAAVGALVSEIPDDERLPFILSLKKKGDAWPTPDPSRFAR